MTPPCYFSAWLATAVVMIVTGAVTAVGAPSPKAAPAPAQHRPVAPQPAGPTPRESFPLSRFLDVRSASAPAFSPDGSELAFLTDITGTRQVWVVPTAGGYPRQWSFHSDTVRAVFWSPTDPDRLIFTADSDGDERTQLYLLTREGRAVTALTTNPKAIVRFGGFSPDGTLIAYTTNSRNGRDFDVMIRDLAFPDERCVWQTSGSQHAGPFCPRGRRLLVHRDNGGGDHQVFVVDLIWGTTTEVTPQPRPARHESLAWHPTDPDTVYTLTDAGRDFVGLAGLNLRTRQLTRPDGYWETPPHDLADLVVGQLGLGHRGSGGLSYYTANVNGYDRLIARPLGHTAAALDTSPLPDGVIGTMSLAPTGTALAVAVSSSTQTSDIWVLDGLAGPPQQGRAQSPWRRLTHSGMAGLTPHDMVAPVAVEFATFDGRKIPAFWYVPGDATPKATPTVLWIHGGPESQFRPLHQPLINFLVHRGFAVLAPNVRGSTGYGKAYAALDNRARRLDAVADLKAAVDWLIAGAIADPRRLAVMGGSYGGYMTLAAITEFPDTFAAAVDLFGIANFETFLENTAPYRRHLREAEYGSLADDRDLLRRISPIHKVDRIVTPLLVIQGANDPRVPASESQAIVEALRTRQRPVEYLLFPDEGHGLAKPANRARAYAAIADFLDRMPGRSQP